MPIGQAQNNRSSNNSQEIPVSMNNVLPEENEYQYVTYTIGESLVRNVHVRSSERIRKSPHWYYPGFGASRERDNDAVTSIVYMTQDGDLNSSIYKNDTMLLMAEWYEEDCMDTPSTFHMR